MQLKTEMDFFAELCVLLGDLCGFAWALRLTAKCANGFRKERKATAPVPQRAVVA